MVAGAAIRGAFARPEPTPPETTPADPATSGIVRTESAGPRRWINGVPSGFSRDEDGARSAAITYGTLAGALVNTAPIAVEPIIGSISTASTRSRRIADVNTALDTLRTRVAGGAGPIVVVQAPVLVRVDSYAERRAVVTSWMTTVVARQGVADPQSTWSTITAVLLWERGDWRLESERIVPGPTPDQSVDSAPPTYDEFASTLRGARQVWGAQ